MDTWSFYDPLTGIFSPVRYSGPRDQLACNTPPGLIAIECMADHLCRRFDLATGEVVAWRPPMPAATGLYSWRWDELSERWVRQATINSLAAGIRAERDRRLAACDWVVTKSAELGEPVSKPWRDYRAALRDITRQIGFPSDVEWPQAPE